MPINATLELAQQHHQAGRLAEAEAVCRQVLAAQPGHVAAMCFLSALLLEAGRGEQALALAQRLVELAPGTAAAFSNLGAALLMNGDLDGAIAAYRRGLGLAPESAPESALIWFNIGRAMQLKGDWEQSAEAYGRAARLSPHDAELPFNLGNALYEAGRCEEAIAAYRQAVALRPDYAEAHLNLGSALHKAGKVAEATEHLRRALALRPADATAAYNLGNNLRDQQRYDEAIAAFGQALAARPDHADAQNNLAGTLKDVGDLDGSLAAYDRTIALCPDSAALHSSRLYTLYFHPGYDAAAILAEHRAWNDRHAKPLAVQIRRHENDRSPDRRLRIGYVSADFRTHPVGLCFEPLLEQHDHRPFEIICFSNVPRADAVTARMQKHADQWLEIFGQSDQEVAELVRQKQIDILVDLSLHMAHNRMLVFARKPAPVQVTYLGYPGTTGLSTVDYRLGDSYIDPPGTEQFHSEKTIRLPRTYLCWRFNGGEQAVGPLPALQNGYVTFGSLNNFAKVTPPVLETWGKLLSVVKDSRLILRCPQGQAADHVCRALGRYGVDPRRLDLVGHLSWEQYVSLYQYQDIGLDPFPYPGHTTSCDSMWMGVPVVTLTGQTSVSRAGASLLHTIGLSELIAAEEQQYVEMARNLAEDLPRLMQLRATLRGRMQQSALMDAAGFARDVEAAYRQMWRQWCRRER
ncbi:MAG: tetratricopeptide repeat protein [Tepidisphaeraceae bacterium]|jgi:predicted O-linked N-acetylglucosamine transferase (SPINDLY family)